MPAAIFVCPAAEIPRAEASKRKSSFSFLADGDVNAQEVATPLVDDGIDGDRGFTDLTVTDDQLTLTTTYRSHGVDGFQTGLNRLIH